jgi:hypothetical protein
LRITAEMQKRERILRKFALSAGQNRKDICENLRHLRDKIEKKSIKMGYDRK